MARRQRPRRHARTRLYKAFRCLPASRLLAADLAGSGLGASTSATELAAKTVPAMGEVIAFPPVLLVCAHMRCVGETHHETCAGMVGFLSKSFHAATGVKGLEGKFEVLMQGRYRFSVSFLGPHQSASKSNPYHQGMPRGHAPSSRATTLLLMITPRGLPRAIPAL